MSNPGHHHTGDGVWRPPELIASIAYQKATFDESQTERLGILYLLAEILSAMHRQAEALETISRTLTVEQNERGFAIRHS